MHNTAAALLCSSPAVCTQQWQGLELSRTAVLMVDDKTSASCCCHKCYCCPILLKPPKALETGCVCLAGDAVSVAISTGGLASSTSKAGNDAVVTTTTVATNGGTAIASQEHNHGSHSLTRVAVINKTTTTEHHVVSWEQVGARL